MLLHRHASAAKVWQVLQHFRKVGIVWNALAIRQESMIPYPVTAVRPLRKGTWQGELDFDVAGGLCLMHHSNKPGLGQKA